MWTDERYRGILSQAVIVILVALALVWVADNTRTNLDNRGLDIGFDFLADPAGIGIGVSLIEYRSTDTWLRAMTVGLLNTVLVSALGIVAATAIGFAAGIMRLLPNWLIRTIITTWVEFTRNVPLLLQIIFWWTLLLSLPTVRETLRIGDSIFLNNSGITGPSPVFEPGASAVLIALAAGVAAAWAVLNWARKRQAATGERLPAGWIALGLIVLLPLAVYFASGEPISWDTPTANRFGRLRGGLTVTPELVALWFALSTYTGAFISEIVRAGILSVSKGQTEAAGSLGLKGWQTTRLIIMPQALRVIIPPLTSQYLNLTKNSSLALAVGFQDFVGIGSQAQNQTGQAIEIVFSWMVVYVSLSLLTSAFMNWYNARIALVER
ncbi:MAG: ABC transporter permease subunit [Alphaproteobacteria bacterium]|nr:ABC transporter permease subunit [Alphaproteobacteria bacterium]